MLLHYLIIYCGYAIRVEFLLNPQGIVDAAYLILIEYVARLAAERTVRLR